MGRRILAVVGAFLVFLLAAVPTYAATPSVDSAYLSSAHWKQENCTFFEVGGVAGNYQIYADTENHCLYFAVSLCDNLVAPGAGADSVALNLQVSSTKFTSKKFTFVNGADSAVQTYAGFGSGCSMRIGIMANGGSYWTADGKAYFAIALDKSLCAPLTARLDYSCGDRGVCILSSDEFDFTLPEKSTTSRDTKAATSKQSRQVTAAKSKDATKKVQESSTKFAYTGTVLHTTKNARKSTAQVTTKFAYSGGTSAAASGGKQTMQVEVQAQGSGTAAITDGTYTAAVTPTHRSTMANILIYLAVAFATAAIIAIAVGIVKSRKAKQEEALKKQRQLQEQETEAYDE